MTIVVNAVALRMAGGLSVALNFLRAVQSHGREYQLYVFAPGGCGYEEFESDSLFTMHYVPKRFTGPLYRWYVDHVWLPKNIAAIDPDVIFSMGNLATPAVQKQVVLFHWAYATYPECEVWDRMSWKDSLLRKTRIRTFRNRLKYATILVPQTETSAKRLKQHYPGIKRIEVIPNPVALPQFTKELSITHEALEKAHSARRKKLLCLSRFYPHKNLEILLDLAELIRDQKKPYVIITTISPEQHPDVNSFLDTISERGLGSTLLNLGPVPMDEVAGVYQTTDGLLLPTLLESFSGTYVDAMHHGKPVFTSNRDFAWDVCGDAGYYFDPLDPQHMLEVIDEGFQNAELMAEKIQIGKHRVTQFPDWNKVAQMYLDLLEEAAGVQGSRFKVQC